MHFKDLEHKFNELVSPEKNPIDFYIDTWNVLVYLPAEERKKTLSLSSQLKNKSPFHNALHNVTEGLSLLYSSEFESALRSIAAALPVFSELNIKGGMMAANTLFATCYRSWGQLDKAQSYIQSALQNAEGLTKESEFAYFIAIMYYQAAEINSHIKNYEGALELFNRGLEFKSENSELQGRFLNGIGVVLMNLERHEEAIICLENSLKVAEGQKNFLLESKILTDIGTYYFKKKDFKKAFSYYEQSLEMRLKNNMLNPAITTYIQLAELCLADGNPENAVRYGSLAVENAEKLKVHIKLYEAHFILSKIYESLFETEKAFFHYKKYHHYKDEVHSQEVTRKMEQLNSQHKIESVEKEKEIFRLRNVELKEAFDEIARKNKELFRLSLVASETNNAIIILSSDGKLEWLNQMFTRFSGKTISDLERAGITTIFHLSKNENIKSIFNECITSGKSVSYESHHVSDVNTHHWLLNTLTPVLNETGAVTNFIIIATDITERKIQEEIIKEKNKDITDSITYASRIQRALLTQETYLERNLNRINKN